MNSKLDVFSTAISVGDDDVRNKTVIVIDVLRATTTMITALHYGAKCIVPVENMSDAGQLAARLDATQYLLCGEKDGKKIDGYHLGNSPFEYMSAAIKEKTLIFNTTNGTRAITRSSTAKRLFLGALVNVTAVADAVKAYQDDVVLVCSGWKNRLSLEDMLCAGMIIDKICSGNLPAGARDGAKIAYALFEKYRSDIPGVIRSTNHAQRLREFIEPKELDYCSAVDTLPLVPVFEDGMIIPS